MKSKLFTEIKELGNQRVTIWEKIEDDSHVTTVTSGVADEVLNELVEYYANYNEDDIKYSIDFPVITITVR